MIFRQFYDPDLAQGSFLIACEQSREAVVVDPQQRILLELEGDIVTATGIEET